MQVPEDAIPDLYFCEQCRPENHLSAAVVAKLETVSTDTSASPSRRPATKRRKMRHQAPAEAPSEESASQSVAATAEIAPAVAGEVRLAQGTNGQNAEMKSDGSSTSSRLSGRSTGTTTKRNQKKRMRKSLEPADTTDLATAAEEERSSERQHDGVERRRDDTAPLQFPFKDDVSELSTNESVAHSMQPFDDEHQQAPLPSSAKPTDATKPSSPESESKTTISEPANAETTAPATCEPTATAAASGDKMLTFGEMRRRVGILQTHLHRMQRELQERLQRRIDQQQCPVPPLSVGDLRGASHVDSSSEESSLATPHNEAHHTIVDSEMKEDGGKRQYEDEAQLLSRSRRCDPLELMHQLMVDVQTFQATYAHMQ